MTDAAPIQEQIDKLTKENEFLLLLVSIFYSYIYTSYNHSTILSAALIEAEQTDSDRAMRWIRTGEVFCDLSAIEGAVKQGMSAQEYFDTNVRSLMPLEEAKTKIKDMVSNSLKGTANA